MAEITPYSEEWIQSTYNQLAPKIESQIKSQFAGRGARFGVQDKLLNDAMSKLMSEIVLQAANKKAALDISNTEYERNKELKRLENEEWTRRHNIEKQEKDAELARQLMKETSADTKSRIDKMEEDKKSENVRALNLSYKLLQEGIVVDPTGKTANEVMAEAYRQVNPKNKKKLMEIANSIEWDNATPPQTPFQQSVPMQIQQSRGFSSVTPSSMSRSEKPLFTSTYSQRGESDGKSGVFDESYYRSLNKNPETNFNMNAAQREYISAYQANRIGGSTDAEEWYRKNELPKYQGGGWTPDRESNYDKRGFVDGETGDQPLGKDGDFNPEMVNWRKYHDDQREAQKEQDRQEGLQQPTGPDIGSGDSVSASPLLQKPQEKGGYFGDNPTVRTDAGVGSGNPFSRTDWNPETGQTAQQPVSTNLNVYTPETQSVSAPQQPVGFSSQPFMGNSAGGIYKNVDDEMLRKKDEEEQKKYGRGFMTTNPLGRAA